MPARDARGRFKKGKRTTKRKAKRKARRRRPARVLGLF
jgi:hypothetical protein